MRKLELNNVWKYKLVVFEWGKILRGGAVKANIIIYSVRRRVNFMVIILGLLVWSICHCKYESS